MEDKSTIRICTLGTATRDTIVQMKPQSLERMLLHNAQQQWILLESGRKVEADFIQADAGGAAVNSAVNFVRQGFSTRVIAKIGTDLEANFVKENLQSEGVPIDSLVSSPDLPTARSVIIVAGDRNPTVLVDRGANGTLTIEDVTLSDITDSDMLYIGNLSNKSAYVAPWAAKIAQQHNIRVFFNPGIRQITRYSKALKRSFKDITYLALNGIEAVSLAPALLDTSTPIKTPRGPVSSWLKKSRFTIYDKRFTYLDVANAIIKHGVSMVLITDGRNGAFIVDKSGAARVCPSLKTEIMSTLGAGDAYNSTLLAKLLQGHDVVKAMQCASIQASSVIGHLNTLDGLLSDDKLEDSWHKLRDKLPVMEQDYRT